MRHLPAYRGPIRCGPTLQAENGNDRDAALRERRQCKTCFRPSPRICRSIRPQMTHGRGKCRTVTGEYEKSHPSVRGGRRLRPTDPARLSRRPFPSDCLVRPQVAESATRLPAGKKKAARVFAAAGDCARLSQLDCLHLIAPSTVPVRLPRPAAGRRNGSRSPQKINSRRKCRTVAATGSRLPQMTHSYRNCRTVAENATRPLQTVNCRRK